MKINLTNIIEINTDKAIALPVFPSVFESQLIFGINIKPINNSNIEDKSCYIVSLKTDDKSVNWKIRLENSEINQVRTKAKKLNNLIFICTDYELLALEIESGKEKWKKSFKKHSDPEISIIDNRLFFSNWGEIQELNPSNGKKISSKKPRVSWFDSEVIKYKDRFFVSTSNSKILELSTSLEVLNEFKFPGGWAIACKPIFNDGQLISSSYGGKIISFDLKNNLPLKKMNKKAGSKPNQIKINKNIFFYEGHLDNKLTCYDLTNFKKKWTNQIERIQTLTNINGKLISIYKENDKYVVGEIEMSNGKIKNIIDVSNYENWDIYKWDLWEGVGIDSNTKTSIYAFEPNSITIKSA